MSELVDVLEHLVTYVRATDALYAVNFKPGVRTHPMPFFGDLESAEVITVGLNPSATEFEAGRWPAEIEGGALRERLSSYFEREPHPWFNVWEHALAELGASYRCNAAHVDVSPRATVSAGAAPDQGIFERMLAADAPWMIRFLDAAPRVRLVLLAGAATQRLYLDEFLANRLPPNVALLEGSLRRPPGPAKVRRHMLVTARRRLPVFFCSSSPSDRRRGSMLIERVRRHAAQLRRDLEGGGHTV